MAGSVDLAPCFELLETFETARSLEVDLGRTEVLLAEGIPMDLENKEEGAEEAESTPGVRRPAELGVEEPR
jgi:hypothetical protein